MRTTLTEAAVRVVLLFQASRPVVYGMWFSTKTRHFNHQKRSRSTNTPGEPVPLRSLTILPPDGDEFLAGTLRRGIDPRRPSPLRRLPDGLPTDRQRPWQRSGGGVERRLAASGISPSCLWDMVFDKTLHTQPLETHYPTRRQPSRSTNTPCEPIPLQRLTIPPPDQSNDLLVRHPYAFVPIANGLRVACLAHGPDPTVVSPAAKLHLGGFSSGSGHDGGPNF